MLVNLNRNMIKCKRVKYIEQCSGGCLVFYFDNFNGYRVLKSDFLEGVTAFFTTRGQASTLTISLGEGIKTATPQQTHSDHIEFVDERIEYPDTDGLILTKSKQACYLRFADCTPLILYNPKIRIGAVSHAGWRGTAQKIGVKTVEKMGGNPKDIIAVIGPAIGLCCYEVSDDVRSMLLETVTDHNGLTDGKNVDLKGINARQLQEIGVEKIDICHYCTSCNNDLFYSYRRENGTQNRHFAFLMLS